MMNAHKLAAPGSSWRALRQDALAALARDGGWRAFPVRKTLSFSDMREFIRILEDSL